MQRSFRVHIIQAEVKNRCISLSIAMLRPEKGLNRSTQKGILLNFPAANAQPFHYEYRYKHRYGQFHLH